MPEIKHHFRAGRMNKDLDERLVPNGEYRDAQNIEIVTSEGSDVGSVQNIVGTSLKDGKTYDQNTQALTDWGLVSNSIKDLTNPECVGTIVDSQNDKIYWFIATSDQSVSAIAEYNYSTGEIAPVLVDVKSTSGGILNFSSNYLITGINVVEGLLLFTDNQSEPKKINIDTFKLGSTNFSTHTLYKVILNGTTISSTNFTENHITVAKLSPLQAPTLTMSSSRRSGNGTGTSPVSTKKSFVDSSNNNAVLATQVSVQLTFQGIDGNTTEGPLYQQKDTLVLTHTDSDGEDYEIRVVITSIDSINSNSCVQTVTAKIQTIPDAVPTTDVVWDVLLEEEEPLFENKFVRYAYRWKYRDGEYSVFSPFSEIAFLPNTFEYKSAEGYNEGMANNLRSLTININESRPSDVDEIDILYKESSNNTVYVVETLKEKPDGTFPSLSYEVKSEIIGAVVESNQILRPWDNVPIKAKAQEVTANRLIYANYYQNYNVPSDRLPNIQTTVRQKKITESTTPEGTSITAAGKPAKSLKSQRTYQVGVVYQDAYGRQTPVFSTEKATNQIGKKYAETVTGLDCRLLNDPPIWATHYKYFVKETSNEYYNLALDRFYDAEDGNVWLSFPSSERNKVTEEHYLILKKQHDSNRVVNDPAKYKILDIANEPPKFISVERSSIASATCKILSTGANKPGVGVSEFQVRGPSATENPSFAEGFTSDTVLEIQTSGGTTQKYKVSSGGLNGEFNGGSSPKDIYVIRLEKGFKSTDSTTLADTYLEANDSITIKLYQEKEVNKPEFAGKFFVKIARDSVFDTNIIATFPASTADYSVTKSREIYETIPNDGTSTISDDGRTTLQARQDLGWKDNNSWFDANKAKPQIKNANLDVKNHPNKSGFAKKMIFYWAGVDYGGKTWEDHPSSDKGKKHDETNTVNPFLEEISSAGTLFSFANDKKDSDKVYRVTNATIDYQYRSTKDNDKKFIYGRRRQYTIEFEQAENSAGGYQDEFVGNINQGADNSRISEIRIMRLNVETGEATISSSNPAVFETEPIESAELDLYYEISDAIPIIKSGMTVTGTNIGSGNTNIVNSALRNNVFTVKNSLGGTVADNTELTFTDSKSIYSFTATVNGAVSSGTDITIDDGKAHGQTQSLDWFNCYSFGQGVESNRLRDDFNASFIDKGVKVSTVLAEQYKEDHKKNGFIWSGIFNSTSGINRLNQFIQAEPITKDLNPFYGSIQKIHTRDNDLIALCEDKVLNIPANKDVLFNAGGTLEDANLTASNRVLGVARPYAGEYGISKNPESFVSHAYRVYFTDKARGAVLRLSRDGLTNIAQKGMTDWFKDNLANSTTLVGGYNESKGSYNLTLKGTSNYTLSYDERVDGWTSFKSFIPEFSVSLNNKYHSFKNGDLYCHDNTIRNVFYQRIGKVNGNVSNSTSVTLDTADSKISAGDIVTGTGITGTDVTVSAISGTGVTLSSAQTISDDTVLTFHPTYETCVNLLINDNYDLVKGFKTINYEGSDSRIYKYSGTISSVAYTDLSIDEVIAKTPTSSEANSLTSTNTKGWYCNAVTTDQQTGSVKEFIEKEGKWFNYIKGDTTNINNLDSQEFSVQGVGKPSAVSGDTSITGYDVIITLAAETGLTLSSVASASGNQSWEQSGNVITLYDIVDSTNLNTFDHLNLTFTADTGFTLPSSQSISSQSPTSFETVGSGGSAWNSTTGVLTLDFTSQTISSADKSISLDLANGGTAKTYSVSGTYFTEEENTTTGNTEVSYTSTGAFDATSTVDLEPDDGGATTKTFTAASGFYFKDRATCVIYKESDETKNSSTLGYTITQTTPTLGNGGKDSDGNVIKEVFTITYRHPAATITGDEIMFTAKAEKIFVPPSVAEQGITAFKALNTSIPQAGEPNGRTLEIIGTNNSKFFFRRKVFNSSDVKAEEKYWNGSRWKDAATELTIPSTNSFKVVEYYPATDNKIKFVYDIIPSDPGSVSTLYVGPNPNDTSSKELTLFQYGSVTLTFLAKDDNNDHDDDLTTISRIQMADGTVLLKYTQADGSFSTTSPSSTLTYQALGQPEIGSAAGTLDATITIENNHSDGYVNSKNVEAIDFVGSECTGVVSARVEASKTVVLDEPIRALTAGMIVTGGGVAAKSVEDDVTIASMNTDQKTITLSSKQQISEGERLTFSPANDWKFDPVIVSQTDTHLTPGDTATNLDKTVIVLQVNIEQYGTTNLTLPLNVFDCFSEGQAGGAVGTGIKRIGMVKDSTDTTIQGFGRVSGRNVSVGTADNTILSGTIRIFADLTGKYFDDITVDIGDDTSGLDTYTGDTSITAANYSAGTGEGTGDDYIDVNWQVLTSAQVTASSNLQIAWKVSYPSYEDATE